MGLYNSFVKSILLRRMKGIDAFKKDPISPQKDLINNLILTGSQTSFGLDHKLNQVFDYKAFKEAIPVQTYEELFPYFDRVVKGEENVLFQGGTTMFAKSSGTTNAKSKIIPLTQESLDNCHYRAGKDLLTLYFFNNPESGLFDGKGISVGGSLIDNPQFKGSYIGDVSAHIVKNLPKWVTFTRVPDPEITLMPDWEEKIEKMAEAVKDEDVTTIAGVPTWTLLLLERIIEKAGKSHILEVWPNFEVFSHGAVAFSPYREAFQKIIPSTDFNYIELYNATEGFFGIQDDLSRDDMLLLVDHAIFYEFIPLGELDKTNPKTLTIEEVELDKNYALVITTNSGLWRYLLGDTVKFTSLFPHRIKITGRTKHFINAFGEEIIIENADKAIAVASEKTNSIVLDYSACPIYLEQGKKGGHEWLIEFEKAPSNLEEFTKVLDTTLKSENSDYEAKRQADLALTLPVIRPLKKGTFYNWLKNKGKLGGQNKIPRLSNNRDIVEDILLFIQ